jgi:myo-inositol catabolism protein IolC
VTTGQPPAAAARPLLILAADLRASLERDLYRLSAPPTPEQAARISADKLLIYQALLDATEELPGTLRPGILIDEKYGADVAELAARDQRVKLAMPIEASGPQWLEFAYGAAWQEHAEHFATDYAKVLIRDNPGLDAASRAAQADRLAEVSDWSARGGRPLMVELLVPANPTDLAAVDADTGRYNREVRPRLTVEAIEYLQDRGVAPAFWKVEGLDAPEDAAAIVAAARRGGRGAECIVLGRHASHDDLDDWLQVAAPVPGFTGFAIGRSIWWDPLHARLHHRSTASETRRRIMSRYVDFAMYYLDARDGTRAAASDPEFW